MTPQEHIAAAMDFLALADQPVARQRPLLQSELFWCAAAHAVKAVAQQQGWRNRSHDDLFNAVAQLANNINAPHLIQWFDSASNLHRNMYEGNMNANAITRSQEMTRRLIHRLANMIK